MSQYSEFEEICITTSAFCVDDKIRHPPENRWSVPVADAYPSYISPITHFGKLTILEPPLPIRLSYPMSVRSYATGEILPHRATFYH